MRRVSSQIYNASPMGGGGPINNALSDNSTVISGLPSQGSAASAGRGFRRLAQQKKTLKFGSNVTISADVVGAPFHGGSEGYSGPVPIKKMFRNDHLEYTEGTILFCSKNSTDRETRETTAVALQNFNARAEYRARQNQNNRMMGSLTPGTSQIEMSASERKRARANDPSAEFYPLKQEEFIHEWQFMGVVTGSGTRTGFVDDTTNKRLLDVQFYGMAKNIPNIWGVQEAGQEVGFIAKEVMSTNVSYMGINGEELGKPTTVPYFQLIPYAPGLSDDCVSFPANSSHFMNPGTNDRDYWRSAVVEQQVYPTKTNGLPSLDSPPSKVTPLSYNHYLEGAYIRMGTVVRTTSPSSTIHMDKACRSFRDYALLRDESNCDIYIRPYPEIPLPIL